MVTCSAEEAVDRSEVVVDRLEGLAEVARLVARVDLEVLLVEVVP